MPHVEPDVEDIDQLLDRAMDAIDEQTSRVPDMTYEEGIYNTIRWLFGRTDTHPYQFDEEL